MAYLYKGRKQEKKFNAKTSKLPDARIILRYLGAGLVIVFCLIVWEGAVVRVFKASYVAN